MVGRIDPGIGTYGPPPGAIAVRKAFKYSFTYGYDLMRHVQLFPVLILLLTFLLYSEGGDAAISDDGLVLHYDFEEFTSGSDTVQDMSGNGNHGDIVGSPDIVEDSVIGRGIGFDLSEGISVRNATDLRGSFTISMWISPEKEPVRTYMGIIDDGYAANGVFHRILLGDDGGWVEGALLTQFHGNFFSSSGVVWDAWNHIVYVYDEDANLQTYYINGIMSGSIAGSRRDCMMDGDLILIGAVYDERYSFFGMMDEIRIYDRALPKEAVLDLTRMGMEIAEYHFEVEVLISELRMVPGEKGPFDLFLVTNLSGESIVEVSLTNRLWLQGQGIDVELDQDYMYMYPGESWRVSAIIEVDLDNALDTYPLSFEIVSRDIDTGNTTSRSVLIDVSVEDHMVPWDLLLCLIVPVVALISILIILFVILILVLVRVGTRKETPSTVEPMWNPPLKREGWDRSRVEPTWNPPPERVEGLNDRPRVLEPPPSE
ncbi:MAG: LamG domain-containing protein [Candidatus Thermoplasmatota archaeon]|nr:LamG domain-containing protein [Candidatus Thermoplasmatota archaeon]